MNCGKGDIGTTFAGFPPADSPLRLDAFFDTIYRTYDLRFPYLAASVSGLKRHEWEDSSPALEPFRSEEQMLSRLGYRARVA